MDSTLVVSATLTGAIGSIAPFILPSFFSLLEKIFKRVLDKAEKRLIITLLAVVVSLSIIITKFAFNGELDKDIYLMAQFFFVNFVAIKGMVQTIYELIIKSVPALEERFS